MSKPVDMSKMGVSALMYAKHGWHVLPLRAGQKEPLTDNGFYDATTDEAQVLRWWRDNPDANIGVRVGPESNLCVIDEDNKGDKDGRADVLKLEQELGPLPVTFAVRTASENAQTGKQGTQYYYQFPDELRDALLKKQLADGVDVKAKGGYVVAAPSVINGRAYAAEGDLNDVGHLPQAWTEAIKKGEPERQDLERLRPKGDGSSICEQYGISMGDVLTLPAGARQTGEGYLMKHPEHGATGKGNLFVNTSLNLWCCYRHGTGGDPLTWVAVREGFIDCRDAGRLDTDTVKRCVEVLQRDGLIPEDRPKPVTVVKDEQGVEVEVTLRGLDDIGNVERFISRYGDVLRYQSETKRWFYFNGTYWERISPDCVRLLARDVIPIITYEIGVLRTKLEKQRRGGAAAPELAELEVLAKSYEKWGRATAYRSRLEAIVEMAKGDLMASVHDFDANPLLFNCANGTYDIATGELRPHDKGDLMTHFSAVRYPDDGAIEYGATRWHAFFQKVQPSADVRDFLKRAGGYSLTALVNEEALFYNYGPPATGKSTFLEAFRGIAGTYARASKFKTFLEGRVDASSPREDVARLIGARTVICNEVSKATRWDSALIKTLVSGDRYLARVPYSDTSVEFDPAFKLWFGANDRPKLDFDDSAAFRRFFVVPWDVFIPEGERDKSLKDVFRTDVTEQQAILRFFLDGATEWYKLSNGGKTDGLHAPEEVKAAVLDYMASVNPLYEFLLNECVIGIDVDTLEPFEVPTADLWDAFSDQRQGYDTKKVKGTRSMGKYLSGLGFESFRQDNVVRTRAWRYLRLLAEGEEWPPEDIDHDRLTVYKATLQKLLLRTPIIRELSAKQVSKRSNGHDNTISVDVPKVRTLIIDILNWLNEHYYDLSKPLGVEQVRTLIITQARKQNGAVPDAAISAELDKLAPDFIAILDRLTGGAFSLTLLGGT